MSIIHHCSLHALLTADFRNGTATQLCPDLCCPASDGRVRETDCAPITCWTSSPSRATANPALHSRSRTIAPYCTTTSPVLHARSRTVYPWRSGKQATKTRVELTLEFAFLKTQIGVFKCIEFVSTWAFLRKFQIFMTDMVTSIKFG